LPSISSFLFQPNARIILNTYTFIYFIIYHQLHHTCFGVYYTISRETIALFAQKLFAVCNVVTLFVLYNVKFTMFFSKTYNAVTMVFLKMV